MRTFLALELPEQIKKQLQIISNKLQSHNIRNIKWVEPDNYHFTLTFIGDTENHHEIVELIETTFDNLDKPEFSAPRLELVPGKAPRILWAAYQCNMPQITAMNKKFRHSLSKIGYKIDKKPLRFHVTLARIKGGLTTQFTNDVVNFRIPPLKFRCESLTFYQSRLKPEGAEYLPISELKLN